MAIKKRSEATSVAFDVIYEDGSRSSNRRVPTMALSGLDGDLPAKAIIEAQDREISVASGRQRPSIKSIARSPR
ncbi:MAG TPA: hypothetical protein VH020_06370 [Stellaceae bacterium]|jgi:hypothetical protein|nr:hypothetical protein [Stellaceae bacterium]